MKEINVVTTSFKYGGGMERYITDFVQMFLLNGYKVNVYCLKYDKSLAKTLKNINVKQFKLINKFPRFLKYISFALRVKSIIQKSKIKTFSTARILNADVAIIGGTHKIHGEIMGKKQGLYDKIETFLEKSMYKNAKAIIAHSDLMVEEINAYNLNIENKIKMIFPPVSQKEFKFVNKSEKIKYKQKLKLPTDKYIVLGLGDDGDRKGIPSLVKAIKKLDPNKYFLVIIGKKYNKSLPVNAKYFGEVNNVQDFYAAADITVAPSLYEPFGLITIESLEVGTPVVISKFLGSKGFVNNSNGIIINDISPETIKNAIELSKIKDFNCEENFIENNNLSWPKHFSRIEKTCLINY